MPAEKKKGAPTGEEKKPNTFLMLIIGIALGALTVVACEAMGFF